VVKNGVSRNYNYISLSYQLLTMHVVIFSLQISDFMLSARFKMPILELFIKMSQLVYAIFYFVILNQTFQLTEEYCKIIKTTQSSCPQTQYWVYYQWICFEVFVFAMYILAHIIYLIVYWIFSYFTEVTAQKNIAK